MKPWLLEQNNLKQIKSENFQLAVLPWGATEPHNYHLPYGTDSLETSKIASDAGELAWQKGAKIMVLPTIPLGVQNVGQIKMPFCLHTTPTTQKHILYDILSALAGQGINKLVVFNGHGGNDFIPIIRELQPQFEGIFISLVEWFKILDLKNYFENEGDHAGEMETSVILHYFPELVLPLNEAGEGKTKSFKLEGLKNNTAWAPRNWAKISTDTGVGNPKKASALKGKKYINDLTRKIADYFIELAFCDLDNLYDK